VTEGLSLAEAAKTAVSESYSSNPGVAIVGYGAGCPAIPAGSFGYQCKATTVVTDIRIGATAGTASPGFEALGAGGITITYAGASGLPAGTQIGLDPGTGVVAGGMPPNGLQIGSPISWGCHTGAAGAAAGTVTLYPYLPANCRF